MKTTVSASVRSEGFAFLPCYMPDAPAITALSSLGSILPLPGLAVVQELKPQRTQDAPPNIYSGNFGYGSFPLHTDLAHWSIPPPYFVLRCVSGAPEVSTQLVPSRAVIDYFGEVNLRRTLVRPRRPLRGLRLLLRLLDHAFAGRPRLRWDTLFVTPATPNSSQVCLAVSGYLDEIRKLELRLRDPGDTLVIDNWRMLHGRSRVPETCSGRILHRAYLGELR